MKKQIGMVIGACLALSISLSLLTVGAQERVAKPGAQVKKEIKKENKKQSKAETAAKKSKPKVSPSRRVVARKN